MSTPDASGQVHSDVGLVILAMSGTDELDEAPLSARFDCSSAFAAALSAHYLSGSRYSAALSAYAGTKNVDKLARASIHAAVATGVWSFDSGNSKSVITTDLSQRDIDQLVAYGAHTTAGTQLMSTGQHMADSI